MWWASEWVSLCVCLIVTQSEWTMFLWAVCTRIIMCLFVFWYESVYMRTCVCVFVWLNFDFNWIFVPVCRNVPSSHFSLSFCFLGFPSSIQITKNTNTKKRFNHDSNSNRKKNFIVLRICVLFPPLFADECVQQYYTCYVIAIDYKRVRETQCDCMREEEKKRESEHENARESVELKVYWTPIDVLPYHTIQQSNWFSLFLDVLVSNELKWREKNSSKLTITKQQNI